ncbi:MAG: hypothetical protein ACJATT_004349 [Myxococcota bacterium]|jgi:hypothetical protein
MGLMEETGARVRSGRSPTDDVVTGYHQGNGGRTGSAKGWGSRPRLMLTPVELRLADQMRSDWGRWNIVQTLGDARVDLTVPVLR